MRPSRWKWKVVLASLGLVAMAVAWAAGPRWMLLHARSKAVRQLAELPAASQQAIRRVLADKARTLPAVAPTGPTQSLAVDGYRFSLPAETYRKPADPNQPNAGRTLQADKLSLRILGVACKTSPFRPGLAPTNDQVRRYLDETNPYDLLSAAFRATPQDVAEAQDLAAVQKGLYLLLLKTILATHGTEKLWLPLEMGGRKAILSGDTTCPAVVVDIYLPETKEFANLLVQPGPSATMDDVYQCLADIRIERDSSATQAVLGASLFVAPRAYRP